jgi:hypothetical protein
MKKNVNPKSKHLITSDLIGQPATNEKILIKRLPSSTLARQPHIPR